MQFKICFCIPVFWELSGSIVYSVQFPTITLLLLQYKNKQHICTLLVHIFKCPNPNSLQALQNYYTPQNYQKPNRYPNISNFYELPNTYKGMYNPPHYLIFQSLQLYNLMLQNADLRFNKLWNMLHPPPSLTADTQINIYLSVQRKTPRMYLPSVIWIYKKQTMVIDWFSPSESFCSFIITSPSKKKFQHYN